MVVLVVSLFSAGVLVLLLLAVSVRAAATGRAEQVPGLPLVAERGARFGDATALQRSTQREGLRLVTPALGTRPRTAPFREPRAA